MAGCRKRSGLFSLSRRVGTVYFRTPFSIASTEQIAGYDLEKGHGCCEIIFDSPFMAIFPYRLMAADGTE
jgi:hypothetical protein